MKLLLFSDSHGHVEYRDEMEREVRRGILPDAVLFAGDAGFSSNHIFPELPYYCVSGNCDFSSSAPNYELIALGGHQIYLAHGHLHWAKLTRNLLASDASSHQADIVVYGHTHLQGLELVNNVYCINPGALKNGQYALLNLLSDGSISPEFKKIRL